MLQQQLDAAQIASGQKRTVIVGTWPSTPKGRKQVGVGEYVLCRLSPTQKHGVPGLVTAVSDAGYYSVTCHSQQVKVLRGQLLPFTLQVGQHVQCAHGDGVVLSIDKFECEVEVDKTRHKVSRLAVVPTCEPHTGFKKNPTVDRMRRACNTELDFVDVFAGDL